jgi:hypothetical protein
VWESLSGIIPRQWSLSHLIRIFRKGNNFYKKKDEPERNVKEIMAPASSSMKDA